MKILFSIFKFSICLHFQLRKIFLRKIFSNIILFKRCYNLYRNKGKFVCLTLDMHQLHSKTASTYIFEMHDSMQTVKKVGAKTKK